MNVKKTLYLFTEQFPFGINSEQAFLKNEIQYLCKEFAVIIIPRVISGLQTTFGNFTIISSLSVILNNKNKFMLLSHSICCRYLYKALFEKRILFWNVWRLKRLFYFTGRSHQVYRWSKVYINDNINNKCLIYTYWTNDITLGLIKTAKEKNTCIICKAHGHDLYEEYYNYLPCYNQILKGIKKIFLVSETAFQYLGQKYPQSIDKISLQYLGVSKAEKMAISSDGSTVRIVSCSYIIPLKRIHLIVSGIHEYIITYNKNVEWTHFGSGELFEKIKKQAQDINDNRFHFYFMGFVNNDSLLNYYKIKPVDIFITTSESEGGVPVSLQEAQSHGIPIIGTNVGGIPEIANNKVGVLLSENPTAREIANSIDYIMSDKNRYNVMKNNSLKNWAEKFDEEKNYMAFIKALLNACK